MKAAVPSAVRRTTVRLMPEKNPDLRNSYLSGAFELRSGIPQGTQIADATAKVEGNTEVLDKLASTLVVFDPRFKIMPGTHGANTPEDLNNYEYGSFEIRGE